MADDTSNREHPNGVDWSRVRSAPDPWRPGELSTTPPVRKRLTMTILPSGATLITDPDDATYAVCGATVDQACNKMLLDMRRGAASRWRGDDTKDDCP